MCGICGFWSEGSFDRFAAAAVIDTMTDALSHRGPDDRGTWHDAGVGLALGHRRLAVIDLSPAGHQPMASSSGRFEIAYNGEIYNFEELRATLAAAGAAPAWRGHSDSEVLLAGFDHWGIEGTLRRANGMFAIAIWDRAAATLTLARDRLGEKPLFYGSMGGSLLFGSELKALQRHPSFEAAIDEAAVGSFLRYGYVPAPFSIWRGIKKLPPGTFLTVAAGGRMVGEPQPYWSLEEAVRAGVADPIADDDSARDALEALLTSAVASRAVADVPLGAFLSGGLDSSLIAALLQRHASRPIKTFTIGFGDARFDEAPHARAVAEHLGTDHHELYVDLGDVAEAVPEIATIWDEPFADSSQVPTYLVSRMARREVTVALSGDAGDELFGGYNRYLTAARIAQASSRIPPALRPVVAGALSSRPALAVAEMINARVPARRRQLGLSDRMRKAADTIREPFPEAMYRRLVSHSDSPSQLLRSGGEHRRSLVVPDEVRDPRAAMMYMDTLTYLPDDILAKVDRASMAVALEARVPFLDHRVVEFAWRLPLEAKIKGGVGKRILRDILYRHVPRALIERPKAGFAIPLAEWLKGPLRDWGEALLDRRRLEEQGLFDPAVVRTLWEENLAGRRAAHTALWDLLMFQAWWDAHRHVRDAPAMANVA